MAINNTKQEIFAVQPYGTGSVIANGLMNFGGYQPPNTTLAANTGYISYFLASDSTNSGYILGGEDNKSFSYVTPAATGGNLNVIRFSTTETQFAISQYSKWTYGGDVGTYAGSVTPYSTIYVNGTFYVTGSGGYVFSTDLVNWSTRQSNPGSSAVVSEFNYLNGLFFSGTTNGLLATSTDGVTWTTRTSNMGSQLITGSSWKSGGPYVIVGGGGAAAYSTDGVTWTSKPSILGSAIDICDITTNGSIFLVVGLSGRAATSTDAITWTSRNAGFGTGSDWSAAMYYNGKFYITGGGSAQQSSVRYSTDGITWTAGISGFGTVAARFIIYGNGLFLAGGGSGGANVNYCVGSTDGITWTTRPYLNNTGTVTFYSAAYGNGVYVTAFPTSTGNSIKTTSTPTGFALYNTAGTLN